MALPALKGLYCTYGYIQPSTLHTQGHPDTTRHYWSIDKMDRRQEDGNMYDLYVFCWLLASSHLC